ncbi:serine/threonine protein kinase [Schaalia sp. ZJ405]|uniref:serine/threonine-protein kinase n=1 Tax=Schaalia sp. ZJ405 TaxID=2709403 RepID=UPI0013EAEC91|nr:serine/threonine-protein kinase [Schaalia sp. ZJ405]QPK81433.1 serine/threonine protein kinase [Schaalia sp. ZJ405]
MSDRRTLTGVGRVLGDRYTLLSHIAQGGMGEVWKARDRVTGSIVAAKVLRPELLGEELPLSRLRLEARNAMSVEHPNIANVQDFGEENGGGWIIMELVEGRPLTDYLRGGARIAPNELIPLLMQVAMALGAADQAGVVHRDIKPANILVRPDGMVKLTDFGISRTSDQVNLTAAGMVMGTAQYLPPEQAMGETATALGDLYALGVIAYEAVAGRRPFTGESQVNIAFSHVNDPVPPLPDDVPHALAAVILHLLEKDPSKRPNSGRAVVRELAAAAQELGLSVSKTPLTLPQSHPDDHDAPRTQTAVDGIQRPIAPVRHVTRRTLPEEMLHTPAGLAGLPKRSSEGAASASDVNDAEPMTTGTADRSDDKPGAAPTRPQHREHLPTSSRSSSSEHSDSGTNKPGHGQSELFSRLTERALSRGDDPPSRGTRRQLQWHSPSSTVVDSRKSPAVAPIKTRYNRSVVAPPASRLRKILIGVLIALVVVALMVVMAVTIHNMFDSLGASAREVHSTKEVLTWQSPSAAV